MFTTLFGVRSHDQNLLAILHLECHVARVNLGVLKEGLETSLYGYLGFRSGYGAVRYVSQICKAIVSDPMIATMVTEGLAVVAGELLPWGGRGAGSLSCSTDPPCVGRLTAPVTCRG